MPTVVAPVPVQSPRAYCTRMRLKLTLAVLAASMVIVQVVARPALAQAPDQLYTRYPVLGVAVRVTLVPLA